MKSASPTKSIRVRQVQNISCKILEGRYLTNEKSAKGQVDTYCRVQIVAHGSTINNARICRTATLPNTVSPFYAETLTFEANQIPEDFNGRLYISVWREWPHTNNPYKAIEDKHLGYISLPALYLKENLFDEEQWFTLLPPTSLPYSFIDGLTASLGLNPPTVDKSISPPQNAGNEKEKSERKSFSSKKPTIPSAGPTKVMDGELRIKITRFAGTKESHTISVGVMAARSLKSKDAFATVPEAYVVLHMLPDPEVETTQITQIIKRTSPVWNETFLFALPALDPIQAVHFSVWDANDDEFIGQASVPLGGIQPDTKHEEWIPLLPPPVWWTPTYGKGDKKKKRDSISNTLHSFNLGSFSNTSASNSNFTSSQPAISMPLSPGGTSSYSGANSASGWKGKAFVQGIQSVCVGASKTKRPHKLLDTKFRSVSFCTHCGDAMQASAMHLQCAECKISCHVHCGKYTSNNCGGIPTLRLKIKFSELPVLPMNKYQSLAELLIENSYALPRLLGQASTEREAAAQCLVTIMSSQQTVVDFINEMVSAEVACAESITTLFRANSLASKVVDVYMKFAALPYLSLILGDVVKQIFVKKLSCEVDPAKLEKGEDIKKNFANLNFYATQIVDIIFKSRDALPETLKVIFHNVQTQVERKFPGEPLARYTSVAGFIFLRFFAPALLGPKLFGLSDENGDVRAQRTFTLLAKILQKLANLVEFNQKEAYLEICNQFVMGRMESMRKYIDEISMPSGKPVTPSVNMPDTEVAEECAKLCGLFDRCNSKMVEIVKPSEALLVKKLTVLLSEYGNMIANPESMSTSESTSATDAPGYMTMVKRDPSRRSLMKRSAAEVMQQVEESSKEAKVCTAIPNTQTIIEESVQAASSRHKMDFAKMASAAVSERIKLKKTGTNESIPLPPEREKPLPPSREPGTIEKPAEPTCIGTTAFDIKSEQDSTPVSQKGSPRPAPAHIEIPPHIPTFENIRNARSSLKPLSEDETGGSKVQSDPKKIDFGELRKKLRDHSVPTVNAFSLSSPEIFTNNAAAATQSLRQFSRLARGKHPPSIITGAPDTIRRGIANDLQSTVQDVNESLERVKLKSTGKTPQSQSADMLSSKTSRSAPESESEGVELRRGSSISLMLPPPLPPKPFSPKEEKPRSASTSTLLDNDETTVKTPLTANQANILSQLQNSIGLIASNTTNTINACAACNMPFGFHEQVKLADRLWHPNCIRCCICNTVLPVSRALYSNGSMYCENDFAQYVQPPVKIPDCAVCKRPISSGLVVQGLNKTFHSDCFKCHACAVPLRGTFIPIDGKPYCRPDFFKLMGLMCGVCGECIEAEYVEIGGRKYHQHCKTCIQCGGSLAGKQYFTVNGDAFCASHRDQIVNCRACGQVINGPVLTALKRQSQYHVEHFCCASCGTNLAEVPFYEKNDQPYCRQCHVQSTE